MSTRRRNGNELNIATAAKLGLLEQVKKFADQRRTSILPYLNEALRNAAMYGHDKIMDFLLATGGDVNFQDSSGSTLLFRVVHNNFPDCVEVLLRHGADANTQNIDGDTALHVACENRCTDCLRILSSHFDIKTDIQNKVGLSPLMIAAKVSFVFGVTSLIQTGCDVNRVSRSRKAAIHYCLGKDIPLQHDQGRLTDTKAKCSCLQSLVHAGADINYRDGEGFVPLHYAVKTGSMECVKLLVTQNCYLNQHGYFGHISPQKMKTLLCRGDMSTRATPITAFLLAVYYKDLAIARFLVESGCEYYRCEFVLGYLTENDAIYQYLVDVFRKVRDLQKLCVMSVREAIGIGMERKVKSLHIPNQLKRNICDIPNF